jgi:hypothetical protein
MEDLLLQIVKEASGSKFQHIKQAAQIAHGEYIAEWELKLPAFFQGIYVRLAKS